MLAALMHTLPRCRSLALLASLCLVAAPALAQLAPLSERLAEIGEINRFVPARALPMLLKIEPEARAAPLSEHAEFLAQLCGAYFGVGEHEQAIATCDEL